MPHRHAITDADWDRIKDLLPGRPGQHGGIARDHRLVIDAVLYVARTGIPRPDLPARFGKPNSVWRRLDRRAAKGRWDPIPAELREPELDALIPDSTAVRAHPRAAGAKKSGTAPAASPSRPWAAAGAGSGRRSMAAPTGSGTPSSCS